MRWVFVACLLCLGATAGMASETNWGTWAEEVRKQHPLAGSIYVVAPPPPTAERPWRVPVTTLFGKADFEDRVEGSLIRPLPPDGRGLILAAVHLSPRIVLLGEVHDNPMHHQVRAWLIENTAHTIRGWRPAVVFEQIRTDQQPALERFRAFAEAGSGLAAADELFRLLDWDKSGWPPALIYKPLFEAALAAKLPIYAGEPVRNLVRAVARGGLSLLPPEERARLRLDEPMPGPMLDAVRKDLAGSHCGLLPAEAFEGMAAAQRYRDAHLADAVLAAVNRHGHAVLIAGNGHVRKDRAVPWHLLLRAPHVDVTAVLMIEVEEGKTDPEAYVLRDPEGKPAADLLIFTPRAERGDPCEAMREMKR